MLKTYRHFQLWKNEKSKAIRESQKHRAKDDATFFSQKSNMLKIAKGKGAYSLFTGADKDS